MKKSVYAATLALLVIFSAASVYPQEYGQRPAKAPEETPFGPRPGGPMGGMVHRERMPLRRHEAVGMMMRRNPHLAGIMMEMRGEMMRIRGEAMMKQGDVLRRYGARLEKENAGTETGK